MPRWKRWTDRLAPLASQQGGTASLEFITVGMILLIPLVYLALAVAAIQGGALAVEGAARQAARVYVQAETPAEASARAERAVAFALADADIADPRAAISIACSPNPADCLTRRGVVTVTVSIRVPLPLVPAVLDFDSPLAVPLEASATQQVSRFWGAG
ncbi:hypothetical protein [Cryobacterium sp. BB307]|uniref:hypothetical protein n=1 Tax=Cryobacterium sp. BB307 TaxID=2716317 RepID=UPI00144728A9|nr:hypothetical protein [Cryobacterium sp. BB307]